MKTFTTLSTVLFFAFVISTNAYAEKPIAKCVSAKGELTFTDYLCETEERGHNPLLMTESAINPSVRTRIPSVVRADTIAANTLKSARSEAQAQCEQRFSKYFKRKHPAVSQVPDIEFVAVVDQYLKGSNISISLASPVEYVDNSYAVNANIECTVQRFKTESDWMVGFRETR